MTISISGVWSRSASFFRSERALQTSIEHLSFGSRLNHSADDPVGFEMVTNIDTTLRSITRAAQNVNETKGYVNVTETTLSEMMGIVERIRELATEAKNGDTTIDERVELNIEVKGLIEEFNDLASDTEFNSVHLLNGSFGTKTIQTGVGEGNTYAFSIGDARAYRIGRLATISGVQDQIGSASNTSAATQVLINGVMIGASVDDELSYVEGSMSALAVATAINQKSNETGVTAEVQGTEVVLNALDFSGIATTAFDTDDLTINGVSIIGRISTATAFANQINAVTSSTGVVAVVSGNQVILKAADGRNVNVGLETATACGVQVYDIFNAATAGNSAAFGVNFDSLSMGNLTIGASATNHQGAIMLVSSKDIVVSGGASASTVLGFSVGTTTLDKTKSLANVDVSSESGAIEALRRLDQAISDIDSISANIGAIHDRLDSCSSVLTQLYIDNSEARSLISDPDYALELADFVANQIRSDAGIAALAQANVQSSTVMKLLEGLF